MRCRQTPFRHLNCASLGALFCGLAAVACLPAAPAALITYDLVTVGNSGNANDATGYGGVAYAYQIGKYDVTIAQYAEFVNAVDTQGTNPYGIYNPAMGTDLISAGISFDSGAAVGAKYSVIGPSGVVPSSGVSAGNRPITYVSWFDAARFSNWMTNGQGSGSTETGAYTLNGATSGNAVAANAGAAFRLPTENEWYKAAYYSPRYGGVGVPGYYAYATQSNAAPDNHIGSAVNQANYAFGSLYSVTQSSSYSATQNYLTDVGAFSGSGSFYGTFDQNGNVYQWNDLDGTAGSTRGIRGGNWSNLNPFYLSSSLSYSPAPSGDANYVGFRLAAVPEPSTYAMALLGLAFGGWQMSRRRRER